MAKTKVKTGNVEIPIEDFNDGNITAHISIRLPLPLLKDLRRLALTEEFGGKYQVLIRDILSEYVAGAKKTKRKATA